MAMNIEINNVSKTIKKAKVMQHVSMTLSSNKIVGFQGVNGSGKTMLMRLIAGLIKPTEGEIFIDKKRLWKDIHFPESMGILIENPAFIHAYTGFENLKLLASIKNKISTEKIQEKLEAVGLCGNERKKYRKYSLGMKQRLGIAAAIMEEPDLLLLDEPTNALDTDGIAIVKAILRQERARGALVIIACHDISMLKELCDEIYHIGEGRILSCEKACEKGEAL